MILTPLLPPKKNFQMQTKEAECDLDSSWCFLAMTSDID